MSARPPVSSLPPSVVVRAARPGDADCIGILCTQVYLATYATNGIRPLLVREVATLFSVDVVRSFLAAEHTHCLVVERAGHLIGFAQMRVGAVHASVPSTGPCELERLYVLQCFAGQGVGSALLATCESVATAHDATTVWLTAWVHNARALAFYARRGYVDVGADWYVFEHERHENRVFRKDLAAR